MQIRKYFKLREVFLSLSLFVLASNLLFANSLPNFTSIVDENIDAVVIVNAKKNINDSSSLQPNLPEEFKPFFDRFFENNPMPNEQYRQTPSFGSGFIISQDGYIMTNNHVVAGADEITITLNDESIHSAKLVGSDKRSDLALLKIDMNDLPVVTIGNSSDLKLGEWVLAIGSPFGFDRTVTAGIVSGKKRNLPNENYVPYIQTDVAINPGNSGGPLFNLDGEVIGVNSQIYSRTGGFMGLSFAVPVNVVENVYLQLKEKGRVSRGWLGVLIQDVTRELAESFDMDHPHGALIAKVIPDGPAEQGGIEVGDIIVKFNGKKGTFSSDLPPLVGSTSIGSTVRVDIIRRSKSKIIEVEILELPTDNEVAAKNSGEKSKLLKNPLNIVAKDLTDKQKQDIDIYDHGIIVEQISVGPAQKSGIRRGDIILLLDNIKVKNIEHFNKLVKELPKDRSISVLIQRRDGPVFLAMKLE